MTYFLDNTFPKRLVEILRVLRVDAVHLQDRFAADIKDIEWLPAIANQGFVILTGDGRIRKGSEERLALEQSGVPTIFFFGEFPRMTIWEQVAFVVLRWPDIDKEAQRLNSGDTRYLNARGKLTSYEELAAKRRK